MRKLRIGVVALVCGLAVVDAAKAIDWVFTVPDYKGIQTVTTTVVIQTWIGINKPIPFDGRLKIGRPDRITVKIRHPVAVFVPTKIRVTSSVERPFNAATDTIRLTDIWAMDLQPELPPEEIPLVAGFTPGDVELEPLSDEEFQGISGIWYSAPVETLTVADLPGRLGPDYDLSEFAAAAPEGIVYLAEIDVPASDFIPEPATLALLALGGLAVLYKRRKN